MPIPSPEGTAGAAVDQAPSAVPPATSDTNPSAAVAPPLDPAAAGEGADTADLPDPSLLSPEEYAKVKDDPKALTRALNKAFTQKTQEIAQFKKVQDAYARDPIETIRILAEHHKLNIAEAAPATPSTEAIDEIRAVLDEAVGPDLAAKMIPAFEKLAQKVIGSEIKPVKDYMDQGLAQAAVAETTAIMTVFESKHPNWKTHEPKMMEIAKGFQPAPGTSPEAFLDHLYKLATYDLADADRVQGTIDRIKNAAGASDTPGSSVSGAKVAQVPKKFKDISEATSAAFAAAKQGIRWEPRA